MTVKEFEVPVRLGPVAFAVSVVVWASKSVIDAVPTPPVKVTDAGYVGTWPLGELDGPLKVTTLVPA